MKTSRTTQHNTMQCNNNTNIILQYTVRLTDQGLQFDR